jgi:hypothetical protein
MDDPPPPAAAPLEFVGYAVIMKRGLLVAETLTGLGVGQPVTMKRGVVVAATLGVNVCDGINVMSYIFVGVTATEEVHDCVGVPDCEYVPVPVFVPV